MQAMHALCSTPWFARLALAWFVWALGFAVAAPIVHPQSLQIVCSASAGWSYVAVGPDGQPAPTGAHALDCPLCLLAGAPAPQPGMPALPTRPPVAVTAPPPATAPAAVLAGAPLPARGPPARS